MDFQQPTSNSKQETEPIIVKADEVDEAGADISTISPQTVSNESEFNARIESRRAQDAQSMGSPKILANALPSPPRPVPRPILRREGSTPAPPQQPPPPAPPQRREEGGNATDSLTLLDLKRLVSDLPKMEPAAYAYEYAETLSFPEEVQEWFHYTEEEKSMQIQAKQTFMEHWEHAQPHKSLSSHNLLGWNDAGEADRESFVTQLVQALDSPDLTTRVKSLECISYIALGTWGDSAGVDKDQTVVDLAPSVNKWLETQNTKPRWHLRCIIDGTRMLSSCGVVQKLVAILKKLCDSEQDVGAPPELIAKASPDASTDLLKQTEASQTLTSLYLIVEVSRLQMLTKEDLPMKEAVATAEPDLLTLLSHTIANLRWEDSSEPKWIPRPRILLLFWKVFLLLIGDAQDVKTCKRALRIESGEDQDRDPENFIRASPLDYHLFRQEITSKYPAYSPPQPLVPIEPENNSILPPLPNHRSRQASQEKLNILTNDSTAGRSILNQPLHIATPAPSPPPSPAGPGGKGGKKQNYQTNQNFPFLYPPFDDSKTLDGKGSAELQDKLSDKRWNSGDVPASILEAGELFAARMRMSRSLRQLWDVRERFIRHERGWDGSVDHTVGANTEEQAGASGSEGSDAEAHEYISSEDCTRTKHMAQDQPLDQGKESNDEAVQYRLDAIHDYYRHVLPDLQSLVIVLSRTLFQNVSALVASSGQNGIQNGMEDGINDGAGKRKTNQNSSASLNDLANGHVVDSEEATDPAVESLNDVRSREISSKAVSGILLNILKFEYLTQLLLDANYLPLILKYFAYQDVDKAVEQRNDRDDLDFFTFCHRNSKHPPTSLPQQPLSTIDSSDDEAAPPPIRRHRRSLTSQSPLPTPPPPTAAKPEVDELGFPTSGAFPQTPITSYAPRFFLTNINLLRILQKITKRKAHRALLLVQYKSSTILRKTLKIPQPDLRLYTLKLFKSQVPYCGRKWRQTNMRVITAIYLHCRPELRDEWLCGGDVDGVVEEAVPLEQAGRSLVHWWHLKEFRDVMEGEMKREERVGMVDQPDEYDFFARELERMGWGLGGLGGAEEEEGIAGGGNAAAAVGVNEFEGGPLQMEGWA
ncbi:MAG: hypothetical protein Q9163_002583 [Psora crenata]